MPRYLGSPREVSGPAEQREDKTRSCHDEKWPAFFKFLRLNHTSRKQVQLHGTVAHAPKRQPNYFPQQMGRVCKLRHRRRIGRRYVAQRIKKLDRQAQFLVKKFTHVRHARSSAAKEKPRGLAPVLLPSIMSD